MKLKQPEAVIFDWDDTLVDTWQVIRNAMDVMLVAMGVKPWTEEEARRNIGPSARDLFTALFGVDKWQEADAVYLKAYKDGIRDYLRLHDGAKETLEFCKERGIPLFVVSAKRGPLLRHEAEMLGLDKYFTKIVGAGDAVKDKPDVAAVNLVLEGSGIRPSADVWFVGDSKTDMLAAHNSGCLPMLVNVRKLDLSTLADCPPVKELKSLTELAGLMPESPAQKAKKIS